MASTFAQPVLLNARDLPSIANDIEKDWEESEDSELAPPEPFVPDWVDAALDTAVPKHFQAVDKSDEDSMPDQGTLHDDAERDAIVSVAQSGVEAIAFYKSFRYAQKRPFKGQWGIFIFRERFHVLVGQLSRASIVHASNVVAVLRKFLLGHERYHYQLDVLLLHLEAMTRQPLYRPYMHIYRQAVRGNPGVLWEEALANMKGLTLLSPSYMGLVDPKGSLLQEIREFVAGSPGAYALGAEMSRRSDFEANLLAQLTRYPRTASLAAKNRAIDLLENQLMHLVGKDYRPPLSPASSDVFWVRDGKHLDHAAIAIKRHEFRNSFVQGYLRGRLTKHTDHEFFAIDNGQTVKLPNSHGSDIRHDELKNVIKKAGFRNERHFEVERQKTKIWSKNSPRQEPVAPIK